MQSDDLSTNQLQKSHKPVRREFLRFHQSEKLRLSRERSSFLCNQHLFWLNVAPPPLPSCIESQLPHNSKSINRYVSYIIFFINSLPLGSVLLWLQFATILLTRPNKRLSERYFCSIQLHLIHVADLSFILFLFFSSAGYQSLLFMQSICTSWW